MALTTELSEFTSKLAAGDLSEAAGEQARRAILDTLACLLAGRVEPVSRKLSRWAEPQRGAGVSTLIGDGGQVPPETAALVNGTVAHALDFDDVNDTVQGHPSVAILPAAIAACEMAGTGGSELITAYVAGFEVMARLGEAIGYGHYHKGWHSTATLGSFGAAAAAASALGLTPDQVADALGLALAQASGTRASFGTMAKPLQAGHAARTGMLSAALALDGFTGAAAAAEGSMGLLSLYGAGDGQGDLDAASDLGRAWRIVDPGIDVKKYPCCFWTHRAADGVLFLREQASIQPSDVTAVEVCAPPGTFDALIYERPTTGLEGKFSMEYVVAAALLDGRLGLAQFDDQAVRRPEIGPLLQRVRKREATELAGPAASLNGGRVAVRLELTGGRKIERVVDTPHGSALSPLSWDDLEIKLRDCLRHGGAHLDPQGIVESVRGLDEVESVQAWLATFS